MKHQLILIQLLMARDHVCRHGIRNDISRKLMYGLRKFGIGIHFYPVNKLRTVVILKLLHYVCEQANALKKEIARLFNPTI